MSGIYLHIPFCKQACHYCNFHFSTSLRYKEALVDAMRKETEKQRSYLQGEAIASIYFGGGTPSLLTSGELNALLDTIHKNFKVAGDAEITIETNPDDVTAARLKEWKALGINRLSIGVQSFFEEELKWMNRAHDARQAMGSLGLALSEFSNITIDLIYGSPLLTDEMWKENVDKAAGMGVPHLSCYALTVEEKTPLYKSIATHQLPDVDADKQARQFLLLMQWMREKGYEHYEVSNFAKPGYRSRHNSSYWKGEKYLGLGPSAHSYNGEERRWNVANNSLYIKSIKEGTLNSETEMLSQAQKLNEFIMISLRTAEGLDLGKIDEGERKRIELGVQKFLIHGLVKMNDGIIQLTDEGMLRADGIASALFV